MASRAQIEEAHDPRIPGVCRSAPERPVDVAAAGLAVDVAAAERPVDVAALGLPGANGGEVLPCESPDGELRLADGEVRLNVRLEHESVSLAQRRMAESPATSTDNSGRHPMNVHAGLESSSLAIRHVSWTLRGD
jgi:hypothetical protein